MGQRSRKRSISQGGSRQSGSPDPAAPADPAPDRGTLTKPRRLSSEERNAQARAKLTLLQPGERPRALIIAVAVTLLLAVANVGLWAGGFEVKGEETRLGGVLIFAAIMLVAAWGMWMQKYWAVLGFQSLLAITVVVAALSLLVASNVAAVLLCLTVLFLGGWLFWSLIRVLGRMQVPRPGGLD